MNKYYIASILWALLILILTLTPGKSIPDLELFSYDKLGHMGIFMLQAYFLVSGINFDKKNKNSVTKSLLLGLLITEIYGASVEVAQHFIPDRSMDIMDLLANSLGVILGGVIFYLSIKLNWK